MSNDETINSFLRPYGECKLPNTFTENIHGKIETYRNVSNGIAIFSDSESE